MAMSPMMPRGLFGSGMPSMQQPTTAPMTKPTEEPKSWLEGGKMRTRDIIGLALAGIGDAFGMPGQQNMSNLIQHRMMTTAQQRAEEQRRKTGFDDFVQRKTWERDNLPPESANPTSLQQNYDWLMRMGNKPAADNLLKRSTDPIQWITGPDGIPRPFSMGDSGSQVLGETLPEGWSVDGGPSQPATGGFRR